MTGTVNEMYLSELHSHNSDDGQQALSQFMTDDSTDEVGTAIAVVTDPVGGIVDASDEFIPELGMPSEKLNAIRSRRSEFEEKDDVDDVEAHNMAVAEEDVEEYYRDYLDSSAKDSVNELAQRVVDGETITLVCFEKEPKWCHRHILCEVIEERVAELEA